MAATLVSSAVFWLAGFTIAYIFGYAVLESVLVGVVLMFSSTIIGVKLLPTTILHHRHTGQIIISVLLLQDLLAILVLLLLQGYGKGGDLGLNILWQIVALPALIGIAWVLERYVIIHRVSAQRVTPIPPPDDRHCHTRDGLSR